MKYPQVYPGVSHYVVNFGADAYKNKEWRTQWHIVVSDNGNGATCQTCQKSGFKGLCFAVRVVRQYIQAGGRPAYKEVGQNSEEPIGELARAMKKLQAHISEGRTVISQYWRRLYAEDDFDTDEKRAQWFFEHRIR